MPNRDIIFVPQNFLHSLNTLLLQPNRHFLFRWPITITTEWENTWPGMCTWGGNVQVLCITRVTCKSYVPSHSHAIWTKSRVGGAFGFGWHYLESKYNFNHLFLFPNSTLFQTQILFQWNTTLAGISRYQLVPKQALISWVTDRFKIKFIMLYIV